MKYISICSGIEAASTAWHGLGWTPLAFSEIEPFPSAVLAHHYPEVPNLGDMSKFREWPEELLAECELLVGGTPCQAFSVAGLRKSLDDARGNLSLIYVQMFHHINEIRRKHGRSPAIALWENVPGVLSTKDNAFGCFISGLLGVDDTLETQDGKWPKAGFLGSETVRVGYRVLDAQYFAVAQRRRRVFLVAVPCELIASAGERACPSEILSLRESVLGNPPTRGEARQAVAGGAAKRAASGGEPYHLDRAMFNQGVNAQYDPQITDDGVAASMVARGPAAVAHEPQGVFPCIDANVDAKWGSNQWVDGQQYILQKPVWSASDQANAERLVDQAGTLNCNMGQRGGWIAPSGHPDPAYALSAGNQSKGGVFGSGRDSQDTFVVGVGSMAVRTAQTSANGHGVAQEVAHTLDQVQGQAIAFKPGQSEAAGGTFVTEEFAPTIQSQNNGSTAVPAVAFKPSHFTRGKDGKPDEIAPPLSADADKGDQDTVIMRQLIGFNWQNGGGYGNANDGLGITEEGTGPLSRSQVPACVTGQRTHALTTRAAAVEEDGTGRGTPIVPAVFTKAKRAQSVNDDESWVPGEVAPTQNQFDVGDTRATTVAVAFNAYQRTEGEATWPIGASDGRKVEVGVRQAMQVRRLTPTECCRLQGFPDDHCDITFRKKPAADGPKYRALGNSMAVPCMAWLGYRIHLATRQDSK
jgi:DNA (cytosine-5)-methyltransferase 1